MLACGLSSTEREDNWEPMSINAYLLAYMCTALLDYYIRTTSTELFGMSCIDDDMHEGNGSENNANNKESRMSSVD